MDGIDADPGQRLTMPRAPTVLDFLLELEDDELRTAALLRRGLCEQGYAVDVAHEAEDAMWRASEFRYAVVVLDVLLPGVDGFEVCRRLRASGCWTPVLLLTARDDVEDRVQGLDAGADDYLTKPFSFSELTARLRALMRRGPAERPAVLQVGDLRLDPARLVPEVAVGEDRIELRVPELRPIRNILVLARIFCGKRAEKSQS